MDKTMVESMPKFRLRHYSYHEKNWTYGGKLYNGKFVTYSCHFLDHYQILGIR